MKQITKPKKMKRLLLLSFLLSITIQINGQQLSELEYQHQTLTQEAELLRKDKMIDYRDELKLDSTYRYDDEVDNLQRKWIYYDYNFANNYSYYHDFDYEGNMEWSPNFIRNREFNADGSVNSYMSQRYVDGEWINSSMAIFEYNDSGYETLEHREGWDNDLQEWIPFQRFERAYNADNTLLSLTYYTRDLSTNELDLAYIITYTNVDNVITEWLMENYNDGDLYGKDKVEVYLNAENERDSTYKYEWNEVASSWDLKSRYIYPENIFAPIRTYQTDQYVEMTDSWDPQFRSVYTDYTDIDQTQYWDRLRSDEGESEFYLSSRLEYFWSNNPLLDTEITDKNEIDIIIPNPFSGNPQITVNGIKENTTFVIFDIYGNSIFTKDMNQSNSFSLNSSLQNGVYFINLIQEGNVVAVKKIIKTR